MTVQLLGPTTSAEQKSTSKELLNAVTKESGTCSLCRTPDPKFSLQPRIVNTRRFPKEFTNRKKKFYLKVLLFESQKS
ncbi:hypothetical protein Y1Q_0011487 [Alligator mississippiensis]|uniref:Uncharacterized protein n=1 Tax=Alligator mississippiensis TaxID=8496 RepID=A0A151LZX1_ALLMI|nr:hypothetical protein Y1Q_0011487 [Alligator mississippiensis]